MTSPIPIPMPIPEPGPRAAAATATPRRLLIVSADMGEGHNAAARAIAAAVEAAWPGCLVERVDTLETMGPGVGSGFRRVYRLTLAKAPGVYQFFYDALWHHPWFARACKRLVGAWSGRRLAACIAAVQPDLVVSTYPMGSAGLDWLCRVRGLRIPTAAWVTDFAPHPFWVYPSVEAHLVMHELAAGDLDRLGAHGTARVAAPPVDAAFRPADRRTARRELGLREDAFIPLVTGGAWGVGALERAVAALVGSGARVQVVAVCGRNAALRSRLEAGGRPREQLVPLGFVTIMPRLMAACDVVVTSAGGVTALEALAAGRPLVLFEPIPGHGRANAGMMARTGLALVCADTAELAAAVAGLAADPVRVTGMQSMATRHLAGRRLEDDLDALAALAASGGPHLDRPGADGPRPDRQGSDRPGPLARAGPGVAPPRRTVELLRPQDAFFLYTETPAVQQHVAGLAILDPSTRPGGALGRAELAATMAARLHLLPRLTQRLARPPLGLTRPWWVDATAVDLDDHVREAVVPAPGGTAELLELVAQRISTPLDRTRPLWQIDLLGGLADGKVAVLFKLHHAMADGLAAVKALSMLLDPPPGPPETPPPRCGRSTLGDALAAQFGDPLRAVTGAVWRTLSAPGPGLARAAAIVSGVGELVAAGAAPRSSLNRPFGAARRLALAKAPRSSVRHIASVLGCGLNEVVLAGVAEALHRLLRERGEDTTGQRLRAIVPTSGQRLRRSAVWGNWTGALPVDLPVGPMRPDERVAATTAALNGRTAHQPAAATFLMNAVGLWAPPGLHALAARFAYRSRWFNVIVSSIHGPRGSPFLAGARLVDAYPILPLAEGVGLAVGIMRLGDTVSFGLTGALDAVPDVDVLARALEATLTELTGITGT